MKNPVKMRVDHVAAIRRAIKSLKKSDVLVGIPQADNERHDEDNKSTMGNAAIGYIMEFGAPEKNIPARPFLNPGVKGAADKIAPQMRRAGRAALDRDTGTMDQALSRAGLIGQNAVRAKITEGPFVPLAPSTIRARKYGRGTKSTRKSELAYRELAEAGAQAAGMSESEMQDAAGIRPLINTGQLRNSISYVVRKK